MTIWEHTQNAAYAYQQHCRECHNCGREFIPTEQDFFCSDWCHDRYHGYDEDAFIEQWLEEQDKALRY